MPPRLELPSPPLLQVLGIVEGGFFLGSWLPVVFFSPSFSVLVSPMGRCPPFPVWSPLLLVFFPLFEPLREPRSRVFDPPSSLVPLGQPFFRVQSVAHTIPPRTPAPYSPLSFPRVPFPLVMKGMVAWPRRSFFPGLLTQLEWRSW